MAARDGDSRQARRNQLVLFSGIAAAALAVFAFWLAAGGGTAPRPEARIDELERGAPGAADAALPGGEMFAPGAMGRPSAGTAPGEESFAPVPLIETFRLDDAGEAFEGPADRDLSAWLPAGSHAQAVVLAGVDASAGISSQGDPRPVLLRITGPAWVHVNASWSDDAWGYLVLPAGDPAIGDAVLFEPPPCLDAPVPYLKTVRGLPGSVVTRTSPRRRASTSRYPARATAPSS